MRVVSALLGLLLLLAPMRSALHLLLVPHRVCAIHGLEEAPRGAAPLAVTTETGPACNDAVPAEEAERCEFAFLAYLRDASTPAVAVGRIAAPVVERQLDATPPATAWIPRRAPLAVAPKQGPPV